MKKKNKEDKNQIKVGDNYPERFTNSRFDFWYFFIIETISDLFSNGFSNYTLTKNVLNKKETSKDILDKIISAIIVLIIMYFVIKFKQ